MDDTQPDIRAQIAVVQKRVWDYWNALKLEPLTSSPESSTSDSSPTPDRAAQAAVAMALAAKLSQDGDPESQAMTREERRKQKKMLKKEQRHKKKSKKDRKRAKLEQQDGTYNAWGNDAEANSTTITNPTTLMNGSAQDAEEVLTRI
jgi:ADP-ribosylglycohydrolase